MSSDLTILQCHFLIPRNLDLDIDHYCLAVRDNSGERGVYDAKDEIGFVRRHEIVRDKSVPWEDPNTRQKNRSFYYSSFNTNPAVLQEYLKGFGIRSIGRNIPLKNLENYLQQIEQANETWLTHELDTAIRLFNQVDQSKPEDPLQFDKPYFKNLLQKGYEYFWKPNPFSGFWIGDKWKHGEEQVVQSLQKYNHILGKDPKGDYQKLLGAGLTLMEEMLQEKLNPWEDVLAVQKSVNKFAELTGLPPPDYQVFFQKYYEYGREKLIEELNREKEDPGRDPIFLSRWLWLVFVEKCASFLGKENSPEVNALRLRVYQEEINSLVDKIFKNVTYLSHILQFGKDEETELLMGNLGTSDAALSEAQRLEAEHGPQQNFPNYAKQILDIRFKIRRLREIAGDNLAQQKLRSLSAIDPMAYILLTKIYFKASDFEESPYYNPKTEHLDPMGRRQPNGL